MPARTQTNNRPPTTLQLNEARVNWSIFATRAIKNADTKVMMLETR